MKLETIAAIKERRRGRHPFALVTNLADGHCRIIDPEKNNDSSNDSETGLAVEKALLSDKPQIVELDGTRCFVEPFNPPPRLVVIGAVHIAQTLVRLAELMGFDPHVVDPRDTWADERRFPGITMHLLWPDEALEKIGIDQRTAIVTLTHDPKIDDPALMVSLASDARYVGALGSKRTHAKRIERLKEEGLTEKDLEKIDAPVGIDIGASTASEIALSIMAQVIKAFRKPS